MAISVCMATYNGEKFVEQQLRSILSQMSKEDEIIIVDDASTDNTLMLITNFADPRIRVFNNQFNHGHVFAFGRALSLAKNEYVFMSDQDDIWIPGRVKFLKDKIIETNCFLITSSFGCINSEGNEVDCNIKFLQTKDSKHYLKNIIGIFIGIKNYFGCAMVCKNSFLEIVLPIPNFVESHDLWIAIAANLFSSNWHLEHKTLLRRFHGNNASVIKRSFLPKLLSRFKFLFSIVVLICRWFLWFLKKGVHLNS